MTEQINQIAQVWWNWMWPMLWQVGLLIAIVGTVDVVLRKHIWPQLRYTLWLLVLLKLVIPPTFALPTGLVPRLSLLTEQPSTTSDVVRSDGNIESFSLPESQAQTDLVAASVDATLPTPNEAIIHVPVSWRATIMIVWLLGGVGLTTWLIAGYVKLSRIHCGRDNDNHLPDSLSRMLCETAKKLNLRRLPRVVVSDRVDSPAVFGIFRPVLLLPAKSTMNLSEQETEHVLLHELAHLKRRDLQVHTLCVSLQIIYWFNPLVYLVRRHLQHIRELCCDATVAKILKDQTQAYCETILETAAWLLNEPSRSGIGFLGLVESPGRLLVRLNWLRKGPSKHPRLRLSLLSLTVIAMLTCVLPMAKAQKLGSSEEIQESTAPSQHQATGGGELAPTFVTMWPELPAPSYLYYPCKPAVDNSGNLYIADWNNRILKFTSDGVLIEKWGSKGNDEGQIDSPEAVAVDRFGNVYVADYGNNRIQKFTADGKFIKTWGSKGRADGEFKMPHDIALDASGNVYVADMGNHRIQKFTSDGDFMGTWGSEGSDAGQFSSPSAVAIDNAGNVYVTETGNNRIQRFTSGGKFITKWGSSGSGEGEFRYPVSVAVDRSGKVYVLDRDNLRIQTFTLDGDFIATWRNRADDGQLRFGQHARGLSLDNSGNVYVADRVSLVIFASDGGLITTWASQGSGEGQFNLPMGVAVDNSGNVYVADTYNHRIQKFTSDGGFIATWGSRGSGEGQFVGPLGLALDNSGNVYVGDAGNRIQKFDSEGRFITTLLDSEGNGEGQIRNPEAMGVDTSGHVYVADIDNDRILKFTSDGKCISKWGSEGNADGEFNEPRGVAVDTSGNIYVADTGNNRIQKFTSDGKFIATWGSNGSEEGEFKGPFGVAVDRSGNIYVADGGNHRIQKFTSDGHFIVQWGSAGSDEGQFNIYLLHVAVDASGSVYVADGINNRIQKFSASQ